MQSFIELNGKFYWVDLSMPIDISIPLSSEESGPNCFYAPPFDASPLIAGDFVGSTQKGSPVNFYNIKINPHGNGTHTECVGHISTERLSVNDSFDRYHFLAKLVSVYPTLRDDGDRIIELDTVKDLTTTEDDIEALIVRSLPNTSDKKRRMYSGTNPPYFEAAALAYLRAAGIRHLLTDLPSVDREEDGGKLAGHKAFWNYPEEILLRNTITELIFAEENIGDGMYVVYFQLPPFVTDAAPSRIILYKIIEK
jgi:arylformamidase